MAEAVGLASGLLALIAATFKSSLFLYEEISSLKSQRQTIKEVLTDLDGLVKVLATLDQQAQQPTQLAKLEPVRAPLECCETTCKEIREMLATCTKHTKDSQASVRDWLKMRYREKSFDDMKKRLSSYKTTLIIAFQSINIQDHSVTQETLSGLEGQISGTKDDLADQLEELQETVKGADASLRALLNDDVARLQRSLNSIAQAQRVVKNTKPRIVIKDISHGPRSRAIAGSDFSRPDFDLTVENVRVGFGATSSAGMYSPETLQKLLEQSSTPGLALALQALHNQPSSGSSAALRSVFNAISAERNQEASYVSAPGLLETQTAVDDGAIGNDRFR